MSILSAIGRALKRHYLPAMTASLSGWGDKFFAEEEAKRRRAAAYAHFCAAKQPRRSKRSRAAHLGHGRRERRLAAKAEERARTCGPDKPVFGSLTARWPR